MKKILLALVCLLSINSYADSIREPEFDGQVIVVKSDSTTDLLPTEVGNMKAKSNAFGFLPIPGAGLLDKQTISINVKGIASPYVMPTKDICMIIRVKDPNENPASYLRIVKFDVQKKKRVTVFAEQSLLSGFDLKNQSDSTINYSVEKYGKSSLIIKLKDVPAGQYGVGFMGWVNFATFSVE